MILRKCTVAVTAAVAATSLGVTPSAFAQPSTCGKAYLCGYDSTNYKGNVTVITQGVDVADLSYGSTAGFVNAKSAYNRDAGEVAGHCAIIYSEKDYFGQRLTLRPHTGVRVLPKSSTRRNGRTSRSGFWNGIQSVRWSNC